MRVAQLCRLQCDCAKSLHSPMFVRLSRLVADSPGIPSFHPLPIHSSRHLQPRPNASWLDGTSNTCRLPSYHTMVRHSFSRLPLRIAKPRYVYWLQLRRQSTVDGLTRHVQGMCRLGRCRLPGSPPRRRSTRALKRRSAGVSSRRRKQKRCRSSPYAAANNLRGGI
jgi:hypothetical protein